MRALFSGCGWVKESYLAKPKKKPEKNTKKLKENIGNELADLMQMLHKKMELNSQICQTIFREIQDLVEQDKSSKIYNGNAKELQKCLEDIEKISCEWQIELEKLNETKKFFKSGCIN